MPLLILLLVLSGSRVYALDSLPLFNDEGLHLTRAIKMWHLHPFWEISSDSADFTNHPGRLTLPTLEREQYLTEFSSGFGLREAVESFPMTTQNRDAPIIASMFPDSCRRANFYAQDGYQMTCSDAPGISNIENALAKRGMVYVLVESPPIGIAPDTLKATASRIATYPRPGETADQASVTL